MVMLPTEEQLGQRSLREWAEDLHESFGYVVPAEELVEEVWKREVLPAIVIVYPNGRREISMQKLKAEVYELLWARDNAQRVFHHITNGLTANLTVSSDGIIAMAERCIEERIYDAVREALEKRDAGKT